MEDTLLLETKESLQLQPKISVLGQKMVQSRFAPRSRSACTCSNRIGSVLCVRHGYVVPPSEKRMKKRLASKEILRRALTPPPKRLALRWLNFRPTPSRLSNMSMA
ncbi:hypothetical protein Lalb_Chr07g0181711 [Lupinus albus]|uniref:Uncharacterized protein n=1 Tax=Lupinus albus TaxID=3870 RepID=A0A6A4Q8Q9_LUPAL|nr:hypothetical protein Lalb_Chr07g0181711 [Lupinus albus]